MKAHAILLAAVASAVASPPAIAGDRGKPIELDAFDGVEGLVLAQEVGSGRTVVAIAAGRRVKVFDGTSSRPVSDTTLEPPATWAWPASSGAFLVSPRSGDATTAAAVGSRSVVVTQAAMFQPVADGLRWGDDGPVLPVPVRRRVAAAGLFLEDSTVATTEWPAPTFVESWAPAGARPTAFFLVDDAIHAYPRVAKDAVAHVAWSTAFLPPVRDGRALLVDLDRDGTPDVAHEQTTNDSGTYTFYRVTPPAALAGAKPGGPPVAGPDLRPARGQIRLTGFQVTPDYVDLDGDGRKDFVVTTIEIDGKNVLAAVLKGRVVARTRAFLNRSASGDAFFQGTPDAEVESSIDVKIQFTYTGSIEVKRSYTILATADLDGDGRKDLVIRTGPDTLSVRRGVGGGGVWSSEPYEIPIPPLGASPDVEGYAGDLTGDGKDDLVLLYRAPPGGKDRTYLLVSP